MRDPRRSTAGSDHAAATWTATSVRPRRGAGWIAALFHDQQAMATGAGAPSGSLAAARRDAR